MLLATGPIIVIMNPYARQKFLLLSVTVVFLFYSLRLQPCELLHPLWLIDFYTYVKMFFKPMNI